MNHEENEASREAPRGGASLRELFEAARGMPPEHVAAWLEAHCEDPALRARVRRLLEADATPRTPWLDTPPQSLIDSLAPDHAAPDPLLPGARLGPFVIERLLGEGGSARVFQARRTIEGVDQVVALKVLRHALATANARHQFDRERQALARLNHPRIARLLDAGVGPAGEAWIALEYCDGRPITCFADHARLGRRERIALLLQVARTIAVAHRNLVVHRDIKPSNVLVSPDGEVKVLDFGIAKLMDPGEGSAGDTAPHLRAFTPAYAAPEQVHGGPVTTATDVFSLGRLIEEVAAGGAADPDLPTADLASVVRVATADEPALRYDGAAALADDLERLLQGRPVLAHPPSRAYVLRRFVARHRAATGAGVAAAAAVLVSLGVALWQAGVAREAAERATEQTRVAQQQAQRAAAVRDLLVGLFDNEIPRGPREDMPTTDELLEVGARRALNELDDTPGVQSELLTALGRVYDHLHRPDKGEPLLDAAIEAARRVQPEDPGLLGAALSERGALELTRNRLPQALALLEQAIRLQRSDDPQGLALAATLDRHALAYSLSGDQELALAGYEEALAIRRSRFAEDSPHVLHSLHAIGNVHYRAGRHTEAAPLLQRAAEGSLAHFGDLHVKTAHYLKNQANNLMAMRRYREAAAPLTHAVKVERVLYPQDSPDIVQGIHALANLELALGRPMTSMALFEECARRNDEGGLGMSYGQAFVLANLARTLDELGERDRATATRRRGEAVAREVLGADHPRTRAVQLTRMRLALADDPASAAALAGFARELLVEPEALGQFRARTEPEARFALALGLSAQGDRSGAIAAAMGAVAAVAGDPIDPMLLYVVAGSAAVIANEGDPATAEQVLRDHIAHGARDFPDGHYAIAELHLALADLLQVRDPAAAVAHARQAKDLIHALPSTHPWHARAAGFR